MPRLSLKSSWSFPWLDCRVGGTSVCPSASFGFLPVNFALLCLPTDWVSGTLWLTRAKTVLDVSILQWVPGIEWLVNMWMKIPTDGKIQQYLMLSVVIIGWIVSEMDVPQNFAIKDSQGRGVSVSLTRGIWLFCGHWETGGLFFFYFFFFWLRPVAYGILVPWPGIEDFLIGNDGTACQRRYCPVYI